MDLIKFFKPSEKLKIVLIIFASIVGFAALLLLYDYFGACKYSNLTVFDFIDHAEYRCDTSPIFWVIQIVFAILLSYLALVFTLRNIKKIR